MAEAPESGAAAAAAARARGRSSIPREEAEAVPRGGGGGSGGQRARRQRLPARVGVGGGSAARARGYGGDSGVPRVGRRQLRRPARVASIRLLAFGEEEMDEGLRALWALNLLTWPAQPCFLIQPNFVD